MLLNIKKSDIMKNSRILNIHAIINMNAGEVSLENKLGDLMPVDLKTAFDLGCDETFLWGYGYEWYYQCSLAVNSTKEQTKAIYRSYRKYYNQSNQ